MGISTVTPRSFNSTGAQSICRANAPDDEKLIESQFLTQCQMEYIHGSGETFVRGSLSSLPTTGTPNSTTNQDIFYLESDVDAISDITLSVSLDMSAQSFLYTAADATDTSLVIGANTSDGNPPIMSTITKDFLLSMINKIEFRVGGLTVQTILPEEIFMRNLSELATSSLDDWLSSGVTAVNRDGLVSNPSQSGTANSLTERFSLSELENMSNLPRGNNIMLVRDGTRYTWTLSIPFMGRSNDMHNCFLQSGAVSNSITMVVFYNAAFPSGKTGSKQYSRIKTPGISGHTGAQCRGIYGLIRDLNCAVDTTTPYAVVSTDTPGKSFINTYKSWLTVRSHTFTKTETDFVQKNIINRIVTASQSVSREITAGEVVTPEANTNPRNGVSIFNGELGTNFSLYQDLYLPDYTTSSINVISYTNKQTIPITIDLANFDLIASHLLIGAFAPVHNIDGSVSVPPLEISWDITSGTNFPGVSWDPLIGIKNVDPINGHSAAISTEGDLVPFISQESLSFTGYSLGSKNKCVGPFGCSIRGILDNWLDSVEVRIGSDTTGRLPAESLLKTGEEFGLTSAGGAPIYVVPLADKPFSTAGVPMARVGTKQVILHVDQRYATNRGPFTQVNGSFDVPKTGSSQEPGGSTKKLYSWAPITKISVVGVGTRVQTTVGGGTSFAS